MNDDLRYGSIFTGIGAIISGILCYFGGTKEIFFVSLLGIILGVITVFISLLTGFTGLVACILLVIFAIVCNVCFSDSNKFFLWLCGEGIDMYFFARVMVLCCVELLISIIININNYD